MREIKFRAWYDGEIFYDRIPKDVKYWDGVNICRLDMVNYCLKSNPHRKDILFMQYTGLKDKNGKEIYEGDILKFYSNSWLNAEKQGLIERIEPITWNDAELCWWVGRTELDEGFKPEMKTDNNKFEVIGNIHEHKHLLK